MGRAPARPALRKTRSMALLPTLRALLLSAAVIVFLIGLVSEQITNLTYRRDP
mgnify:CR=1 FL=1